MKKTLLLSLILSTTGSSAFANMSIIENNNSTDKQLQKNIDNDQIQKKQSEKINSLTIVDAKIDFNSLFPGEKYKNIYKNDYIVKLELGVNKNEIKISCPVGYYMLDGYFRDDYFTNPKTKELNHYNLFGIFSPPSMVIDITKHEGVFTIDLKTVKSNKDLIIRKSKSMVSIDCVSEDYTNRYYMPGKKNKGICFYDGLEIIKEIKRYTSTVELSTQFYRNDKKIDKYKVNYYDIISADPDPQTSITCKGTFIASDTTNLIKKGDEVECLWLRGEWGDTIECQVYI